MAEKDSQIPFGGLGIEVVTGLDIGKRTLRSKKARKPTEEQRKPPAPTRQWWEKMGLMAFKDAAEGWRQSQSVISAEIFGHNVEFGGAQINSAETEGSFKKALEIARRSRISSFEVTEMIRVESLSFEEKLGTGANWIPMFVDLAVNLLAEVYGLKPSNTEVLKRLAHQRRLLSENMG